MIIVLNGDLKETLHDELPMYDLNSKLKMLANNDIQNKDECYDILSKYGSKTYLRNTGLVGLLSFCYTHHLKVSLSPDDFWIILLSEISKEVNKNPELYRSLFTDNNKVEEIKLKYKEHEIPNYEIPSHIFSSVLSKKVNFNSDLLFPEFSTSTFLTKDLINSMFCYMCSPYYSYTVFMCGIKEVKLKGKKEDWNNLYKYAYKLLSLFSDISPHMKEYRKDVLSIYAKIINTFDSFDKEKDFWMDIFTSKNIGSGAQLEIDGWIKDLFITKHSVNKIENFQENISKVKYEVITIDYQESLQQIFGGFEVDIENDNFMSLKYSKYTFKLNKKVIP